MSKVIIIEDDDGFYKMVIPNSSIYGDEEGKKPFDQCQILSKPWNQGKKYWIVDKKDLPNLNEMENHFQGYYDETDGRYKIDIGWDRQLMPYWSIRNRYLSKLNQSLNDELALEAPDPVKVVKMKHSFDSLRKDANIGFWYQKALEGLDDRVLNGEPDKPLIRSKLMQKISG